MRGAWQAEPFPRPQSDVLGVPVPGSAGTGYTEHPADDAYRPCQVKSLPYGLTQRGFRVCAGALVGASCARSRPYPAVQGSDEATGRGPPGVNPDDDLLTHARTLQKGR
ncbi:hypothetical protein Nans01_20560 [Nocardiopsis ansamitocini]|uniref:Uncharacterized protein n=1 Tax=Nocardiopsis ansamitocini TaxID=1670832 RepID=A0A9W6UJ53_9ACTN|nr:hypothetical protein Nans01_20560 [Nocardiopsis ansamitocini]